MMMLMDIKATEQQLAVVMGLIGFSITIVSTMCILLLQQYGKVKQAWIAATENSKTLNDVVVPQLEAMRNSTAQAHKDILTAVEGKNGNGAATSSTA